VFGPGEYSESHHIVPRCEGGGNEPENLIRLSARDHLFAHLILAKWKGGKHWLPLLLMSSKRKCLRITPTALELRAAAKARETVLGRPLSPEHRSKIGASHKGMKRTPYTRAAITRAATGRPGMKGSASPCFKPEEFTLRHKDGRVERGTHHDLVLRLELSAPNFSALKKKGPGHHVQGWSIVGQEP